MKKYLILIALVTILTAVSCIYDPDMTPSSGTSVDTDNTDNSSKITSLQAVIDSADEGSTIDLSQYTDITNYSATINKSLTVSNGSLSSGTLSIVSSGVTLSNVASVSVATNSSLQISGSSLSSLNITSSVSGASSSQVVGRGDSASSASTPTIVITDSTVSGQVNVDISNTFLKVKKFTSPKINMTAKDAQLTVLDKTSTINEITFSKACQVVLEDGTSDSIAAPVADASSDSGATATQIDMKSSSRQLLQLSVASGLITNIQEGDTLDFSSMIVIGTYAAGDGVTVYKPGDLSYAMVDTFTKIESDYTVKVDSTTYYQNGVVKTIDPLSAGTYTVTITSEYENKALRCECSFSIVVLSTSQTVDAPVLNNISVDNASAILKNTYTVGETLSLKGLVVLAEYGYNGDTFQCIVPASDWTSTPSDGAVLTENDTNLVVKYMDKTATLNSAFTVNPSYPFTFVPYTDDDTCNIVKYVRAGHTISELEAFTRTGYDFLGWWTSANGGGTLDETYDFSTPVRADTTVYAKWVEIPKSNPSDDSSDGDETDDSSDGYETDDNDSPKPDTYRIIFSAGESGDYDGTMDTIDVSYDVTVDLPPCTFTRLHYSFGGWTTTKDGDETIDFAYNLAESGQTVTLYAKWTANVYKVTLDLNYGGSSSTTIDATYDCKLSDITPPTRTGYEFQGYYEKNDGTGTAYYNINGEGGVWKIADNAVLYAHWTPKQYAVSLMDGDCECDSIMATYNQKLSVEPNKIPTKTGYTFNGFWSVPDGGVQYIDATGDGVKLWTASDDVSYDSTLKCYNLYAQWTAVWTTDASVDFVCGDKTYRKTALKKVMDNAISITGSGSDGVFVAGRNVTLSPYAIGKYEVTQELYQAVMGNNPSRFIESNCSLCDKETSTLLRPVETISWYDAITFCNKLSILMGYKPCYSVNGVNDWSGEVNRPNGTDNTADWNDATCDFTKNGYRLPTEIEWEFAARGGCGTAGNGSDNTTDNWNYKYSGSDTVGDVAWYSINSNDHTWEVGLKLANILDLYDMTGNVCEWCWDLYVRSIDSSWPVTGPTTNSDGQRVQKGGYYYDSDTGGLLVYAHNDNTPLAPNEKLYSSGLRLARTVVSTP